jgi:hypothetical protein
VDCPSWSCSTPESFFFMLLIGFFSFEKKKNED